MITRAITKHFLNLFGIACSLLEIQNKKQLASHYLRGNLFENLVINRFRAKAFNEGKEPVLTFWRDKNGIEIDLISKNLEEENESIHAWEIKAGATYSEDYFKNLARWRQFSGVSTECCSVRYTGKNMMKTKNGILVPWSDCKI